MRSVTTGTVIGIGVLVVAACVLGTVVGREDVAGAEQRIQDLREDISLLNLINGLNLTQDQMKGLLALAKQARDLRRAYFDEASQTIGEAESSFRELKGVIEKNREIPRQVEARAGRANENIKLLAQAYLKDLQGLSGKAKRLLLESQLVVIDEFKPCLIPPRNLKNPVRAGQADEGEAGVAMLGKLRQMPEAVFQARADFLAEEHVGRIERHLGKLPPHERQDAKRNFSEVVCKAREMDAVQFNLNKGELAASLRPERLVQKVGSRLEEQAYGKPDKVAKFLLSDRAIPMYEQRLGLSAAL